MVSNTLTAFLALLCGPADTQNKIREINFTKMTTGTGKTQAKNPLFSCCSME